MQSFFDPDWQADLSRQITTLERTFMEGSEPASVDLEDIFTDPEQLFFSIEGLSNFWKSQSGIDFGQYIVDLVMGAHNQRQSGITVILTGHRSRLSLYVSLGTALTTRTMLEGIISGIRLREVTIAEVIQQIRSRHLYQGVLTGIPSSRTGSSVPSPAESSKEGGATPPSAPSGQGEESSPLDRVIRGMEGATWSYIIQAHPRPRSAVADLRMHTVDLLAKTSSQIRVQKQTTKQDNLQYTPTASGGEVTTTSGELVNYRAQYLVRLLERELERQDRSMAAGQWTVRGYIGADRLDDVQRLASLIVGTLGGKDSRPDPLRAFLCHPKGVSPASFTTFLTSDEVATLIQFPREEVPGYAIHDHVRFDVDFRPPDTDTLALGHIQQSGRDLHDTYNISLDALTKHAVVVGVTGSGKTTTVMNLLDRMVEAEKPFLVIEPAKTEYRALYMALSGKTELHIYTLGNETIAPFRLNPFEFETNHEQGSVSVLTHIDFLKAVFNASFVLYAPMPQVLEMALHEIYEDKGWDLSSGINMRVSDWSKRHEYNIFPTLTDLYYKVEDVTNRLGYHQEIESNVKAGLKTRVGSLRLGSKGLMLDTARGIPMEYLLSHHTILEMEGIGSDEEKTFIMGLFLARLYEYRRLQAATGELPKGLQHLMIFEEAHRLLKNTSTQVDSESSNMRAQAIEVFTNMLSEVRAYGQGVLVAEQIPSKLAPDVLKNTNLKIVHRLIAQDDRTSVGQTMNLNEMQIQHLGTLAPGSAAVYAEGADHAYLVRFENYKRKVVPLKDVLLKQVSRGYASVKQCLAITELSQYQVSFSPFGAPDALTYQMAEKLMDSSRSKWLWANIMLRALQPNGKLRDTLKQLSDYVEAGTTHMPQAKRREAVRLYIVLGCATQLEQRGAHYGWTYELVYHLRVLLTRSLILFVDYKQNNARIEQAEMYLARFLEGYKEHAHREQGPFPGCVHCLSKCLYRFDVQTLLSPKDVERIDRDLTPDSDTSLEEIYAAAAVSVTSMADRWLGEQRVESADVGFCAALYAVTKSDFTDYEQVVVGDNLVPFLLEESIS